MRRLPKTWRTLAGNGPAVWGTVPLGRRGYSSGRAPGLAGQLVPQDTSTGRRLGMSPQGVPKSITPVALPARRRLLLSLLAVAVAAGLLVLALSRPQGRQGFATPAECVEGYAAASKSGDVPRYLGCLAEPLRSRTRQQFPEPDRL